MHVENSWVGLLNTQSHPDPQLINTYNFQLFSLNAECPFTPRMDEHTSAVKYERAKTAPMCHLRDGSSHNTTKTHPSHLSRHDPLQDFKKALKTCFLGTPSIKARCWEAFEITAGNGGAPPSFRCVCRFFCVCVCAHARAQIHPNSHDPSRYDRCFFIPIHKTRLLWSVTEMMHLNTLRDIQQALNKSYLSLICSLQARRQSPWRRGLWISYCFTLAA